MIDIIEDMNAFAIRSATEKDVADIANIEAQCFPAQEAASLQTFNNRFAVFADRFFVIEYQQKLVGHINGCVYDRPSLPDALYQQADLHQPNGKYQTVMGLAVLPNHQNQGLATALLKHFIFDSRQQRHEGMVLTCKQPLIGFYQKLGFVDHGISSSSHGGAKWHKMLLIYD